MQNAMLFFTAILIACEACIFLNAAWKFLKVLNPIQVQVYFDCTFYISRFEIDTALNCTICSQNSSNVENHHLNYICQSCAHCDYTIFKIWTSKAVQDKTCYLYAIFHVKKASQQRVIISIITGNIIYIRKISRYVLLSYCTLLRIVQNSNKTKTFLVQIQKTRRSHLRCAWQCSTIQ